MADDAAHVPAGPVRDSTASDATAAAALDDPIAESELVAMPARVGEAAPADADVELVGRHQAPTARVGERQLVGVGAGSAELVAATPPPPSAGSPSPWRNPGIDLVDDAPRWSFTPVDLPAPEAVERPVAVDDNQPELPLAASSPATPAPPSTRPMPLFGPVGVLRSAIAVPLLSVITLGVYALAWHHRINREMELFDPKLHSRPRRSLAAVLVPWLAGLLVTLAGAALVLSARFGVQLPYDPHLTTLQQYLLLGGLVVVPYLTMLLPFSVIAVVMTLERLRSVEEHVGATTDRQVRPVASSLLLAVPILGGLVLIGLEQRRLNAIWQKVAPSGHLYS
jgi:hypothetical protein